MLYRKHFQPLLAPVMAELAADMIEYRARTACRAAGLDLPSSSLFPHHPAKIDFARADLSFFVKSLKRVNTLYAKDEELKAGFVERARLLFRLKYRRNFPAVASAEKLDAELKAVLERLLTIFTEVQENFLGLKLEIGEDAEGRPHPNAFFQVLLNLLQIGMTLNGIIHEQLETDRPHLAPHFQTLNIFVVKYFESDPLQGFWTLDETLANYAAPLLEALAASEAAVKTSHRNYETSILVLSLPWRAVSSFGACHLRARSPDASERRPYLWPLAGGVVVWRAVTDASERRPYLWPLAGGVVVWGVPSPGAVTDASERRPYL